MAMEKSTLLPEKHVGTHLAEHRPGGLPPAPGGSEPTERLGGWAVGWGQAGGSYPGTW